MTCAKKKLTCLILDADGLVGIGTNGCRNPQETCPREPGEEYEKCKSVCDQPAHAEVMAIRDAYRTDTGARRLNGATAIVCGVNRMCNDCADALDEVGVRNRIVIP